ncbi:tannase/feruloyl esterase family alpha/beta hydrolase [Rhizobiaceae bacterium BDR2-2]|uniref:Tannase/feruloyl esterase family alpha/beta hydrolase n=1 Tax=Ectorhizobium quercum TaxID=2965071 RepID=A0AAE3N4L6_9HYPH|nr:tannase/feruloyl esterase family alpha/beta hydrolase [Ectorhizobium quercum]MCX8999841.1 tannase/feruloyl esterase family alpha/beta hydrolase [Ectorhizobium quercum]
MIIGISVFRRFAAGLTLVLAMPVQLLAQTAGPADLPAVAPVISCAALSGVDLTAIGGEGSAVTSASETTSDGIPVCSVEGLLAPAIHFQALLPTESWTQRYLQVGCGGLCGSITLRSGASDGCRVLSDGGFVMAATDMGHDGREADWGLDAQKRQDFAFRAQHLTAAAVRALIHTFYGQTERYSYFNGCSDGGREALMEAQRFPEDFDGIIAGAPAMLFQVQNTLYHGWQAVSNTDAEGRVILTSDKLPVLHRAVVSACDALDGAEDGLIADPAACRFDLSEIVCAEEAADTSACLTRAEAEVARKFYEGPRDPQTGAFLTAGQPLYGSELEWQGVYVADSADGRLMSEMAALPVLRTLAFPEPKGDAFTLADLAFTEATLDALRPRHPLFDATNADLSAFAEKGGKLILWHGLADPHIAPANTLAYHKALEAHLGADTVAGFERLYLLPGVGHCGNGEGPANLDLLSAMMAWVEGGSAPDVIITRSASEASSFGAPDFDGKGEAPQHGGNRPPRASTLPAMTRPVYPWPAVARYTGTGDVTEAANWEKGGPAGVVPLRDWPGADLFGPYTPTDD